MLVCDLVKNMRERESERERKRVREGPVPVPTPTCFLLNILAVKTVCRTGIEAISVSYVGGLYASDSPFASKLSHLSFSPYPVHVAAIVHSGSNAELVSLSHVECFFLWVPCVSLVPVMDLPACLTFGCDWVSWEFRISCSWLAEIELYGASSAHRWSQWNLLSMKCAFDQCKSRSW